MAREGVPLIVIQRQLGHTNLGITSIYLQGIDSAEIIDTVHARRAPMIPVHSRCASEAADRQREAAASSPPARPSAASGRSNRGATTAPLPRSRSLTLRSCRLPGERLVSGVGDDRVGLKAGRAIAAYLGCGRRLRDDGALGRSDGRQRGECVSAEGDPMAAGGGIHGR